MSNTLVICNPYLARLLSASERLLFLESFLQLLGGLANTQFKFHQIIQHNEEIM